MPIVTFDQDRVLWDADYRRLVIDRLNRQAPPPADRPDDDAASDVFAFGPGMPLPSGGVYPSERRLPGHRRAFGSEV